MSYTILLLFHHRLITEGEECLTIWMSYIFLPLPCRQSPTENDTSLSGYLTHILLHTSFITDLS